MNGVKKLIGLGLLAGFFNVCAYASFDQREDVLQWLDEADSLGFTKAEVVNYLAQTTAKPSIVPIYAMLLNASCYGVVINSA